MTDTAHQVLGDLDAALRGKGVSAALSYALVRLTYPNIGLCRDGERGSDLRSVFYIIYSMSGGRYGGGTPHYKTYLIHTINKMKGDFYG